MLLGLADTDTEVMPVPFAFAFVPLTNKVGLQLELVLEGGGSSVNFVGLIVKRIPVICVELVIPVAKMRPHTAVHPQ